MQEFGACLQSFYDCLIMLLLLLPGGGEGKRLFAAPAAVIVTEEKEKKDRRSGGKCDSICTLPAAVALYPTLRASFYALEASLR